MLTSWPMPAIYPSQTAPPAEDREPPEPVGDFPQPVHKSFVSDWLLTLVQLFLGICGWMVPEHAMHG